MIIGELLRKWFNLPPPSCATCEVLRDALDNEQAFNRVLFNKLLEKGQVEPPIPSPDPREMKPITPQHVPWRVRQQILESEDRRAAELLRKRTKDLEDELGIPEKDNAVSRGDAEIQTRSTSLGVEIGPSSEGQKTGSGNNAV